MFYAYWTQPAEIAGTLRLRVDPRRHGLGVYEDVEGVRWDVRAIVGAHVCARPVHEHPSYYGTGALDSQAGLHRWPPYDVEVVPADPG